MKIIAATIWLGICVTLYSSGYILGSKLSLIIFIVLVGAAAIPRIHLFLQFIVLTVFKKRAHSKISVPLSER